MCRQTRRQPGLQPSRRPSSEPRSTTNSTDAAPRGKQRQSIMTTMIPARSASRIAAGLIAFVAAFAVAFAAAAEPASLAPTPAALAQAMQGHHVVLLGEVHDNATQHALRVASLRQWLLAGARPAFAFEQFDREHQPDIDRARR